MPNGSWTESIRENGFGQNFARHCLATPAPISEMRVVLLSTGWRQFNFSATPLLQSRLENGGASSLPMLLPTFLINAPESMRYLTDIPHISSIPSKEGQAQTRKEQGLLAQFSFGSALKMEYQAEHYFPANFLCRVIKSWLSIYSPRPSLPTFSLMFITPLNFKCRTSTGYF